MKMTSVAEMVRSGGLGEGNAFSIAASSKAFEVLSSNLYQNKILAVIREISCNAADAHKMAGRPLSDIKIHLPTFAEPWFSVRDYGPSLSHEAVLRLYTTYFLSTKDQDNDLIGGFGLGSKSPFAVADQFTVTTWRDGNESRYVCYKQDGVPNINFIGKAPSTEPTGLEVRVAVPAKDVGRWITEAHDYFSWWPEVPTNLAAHVPSNLTNITVKSDRMVGHYPAWGICEKAGYAARARAVMGLVPYTIDYPSIPNIPSRLEYLQAYSMVLAFDVGDLSISPSRETLSYDAATCATIIARLEEIHASLAATLRSHIDAASTLYDARLLRYGNASSNSPSIFRAFNGPLKWHGKLVEERSDVMAGDFASEVKIAKYIRYDTRKTWHKSSQTDLIRHTVNTEPRQREVVFYAERLGGGVYKRVANYMESTWPTVPVPGYGGKTTDQKPTLIAIIVAGPDKQEIKKVLEDRGLPPVVDVDSLPTLPKVTATKSASAKTAAYVFSHDGSFKRQSQPVDLTGGGIYVLFEAGGIVSADSSVVPALRYGIIPNVTRVIGISSSRFKTSKTLQADLAANGWTPFRLNSLLAALPRAAVVDAMTYTVMQDLGSAAGHGSWEHAFIEAARGSSLKYLADLKDFQRVIALIGQRMSSDTVTQRAWYHLRTEVSNIFKAEYISAMQLRSTVLAEVRALGDKYPLIKSLRWDRVTSGDLLDYLNRC